MHINKIASGIIAVSIASIPALAEAPAGYFQIPGTKTVMKVYGTVALDIAFDHVQDTGPNYGLGTSGFPAQSDDSKPKNQWDSTAKNNTVLGFNTITPSSLGEITTTIEGDFSFTTDTKKSSTTPNVFTLRQATFAVGPWLFGQTYSTFLDPNGVLEYLTWDMALADAWGTYKLPQVRYTSALSKNTAVSIAFERDRTPSYSTSNDQRLPGSLVGTFNYSNDHGHLFVAAAYQRYSYWAPTVSYTKDSLSWGISGHLNVGKDKISARIAKGDGQYGAGLGQDTAITNSLGDGYNLVQATQAELGYTHNWNDQVRSNLWLSQVRYAKDSALGMDGAAFHTYDQVGLNVIKMMSDTFQLGAEYVYGKAKTFDDNTIANPDGSTTNAITESKFLLQLKCNFF